MKYIFLYIYSFKYFLLIKSILYILYIMKNKLIDTENQIFADPIEISNYTSHKGTSVMAISRSIQEGILDTVAQQVWEKELVDKFRTSHAVKSSVLFGPALISCKPDLKDDDG